MSVRRKTSNRFTLFRTCHTCGKSIVTTADTPFVKKNAVAYWNTRAPILSAEEMEMLEGLE